MNTFQELNALTSNCASTFEFSNEDAERILIPCETLGINMSSEEGKLRLERLYQKETRLLMHGSTLSEYWRNKRIPRGLRIQKAPTIGKSNEDFTKRWGEILNKCSLDLMLLIIDHVSTDAQQVKTEIEILQEELQNKLGHEFSSMESSIKDSLHKYKEKLHATKLKKYKRDTDDYLRKEVYEWEIKPSPPLPATAQQSQSASSSVAFRSGTARNGRPIFQERRVPRSKEDSSSDYTIEDSD